MENKLGPSQTAPVTSGERAAPLLGVETVETYSEPVVPELALPGGIKWVVWE